MTPVETCMTWRAEFATELQDVEAQLVTARAALATAESQERTAKATWDALSKFTGTLRGNYNPLTGAEPTEPLAGPLYARLQAAREPLIEAGNVRARAHADVTALVAQVAKLREAIDQIDRLLTNHKVTALPAPAAGPSRRRKQPAVVDFDNIVGVK